MRFQRRNFRIVAALALALGSVPQAVALAAPPAQTAEDGRTIMDASRTALRVELSTTSEMILVEANGTQRKRTVEAKTKKLNGAWRTYTKFSFPPDIAGTQFLVLENKGAAENDMYLYQPINKRTRRVTAAQRSGRFVGTDFYFEDLDIRDVDKDDHKVLRSEDLRMTAGTREIVVDTWVVQSTPKNSASSTYTKSVTWVEKKNHYPRQVELYKGDKVAKRFRVLATEQAGNSIIPVLSEMNDLAASSKTIVKKESHSLDRNAIPDAIFTESYLLGGG